MYIVTDIIMSLSGLKYLKELYAWPNIITTLPPNPDKLTYKDEASEDTVGVVEVGVNIGYTLKVDF